MLPNRAYEGERILTSFQIMEFPKKMDMFPNVLLASKILLTVLGHSSICREKFFLMSYQVQLAILSIENKFLADVDYDKI